MNALKKISIILTKSQKMKSIQMFILILVGMFFETLGVGIIIPIVSFIINPSLIQDYLGETIFYNYLRELPNLFIVILGLLSILIIYFFKTLFLIYLTWFKNRFSYSILADISKKIFSNYLSKDWLFHLDNNSAKLIRNCTTECSAFVNYIFLPIIEIVAELMVLLGILTLLIIIEPVGTLVNFSIFLLFCILYHSFFKNKTLRIGKSRQVIEYDKLRYLQQGFGALRDVKILNCEKFFFEEYDHANQELSNVMAKYATIQQMPRILLEFIAVLCLVTVVASLMINSPDLTLIIPTLAMFGAASMRLLPSANRILGAIQSIRYGRSTIDVVFKELSTLDSRVYYENKSNEIKFKKIISLKSINFKYKSRKIILQNINIKIPKGKFIGIIGESGAGKSTLIDILLGLLKPNSGLVEVDNIDVRTNIIGWQKKIGYVPQDIYLVDDTLRQNIAFGIPKTDINNEKVLEAIKLSKLDDFVASLEDGLETLFGERGIKLSGGQLQRVAIARALYRNPEILILDEATSALDNETENFVMESVKNLKGLKTIIVITHRISTILNSDYVYKLKNGFIEKEGKPIDILNKSIQINTF